MPTKLFLYFLSLWSLFIIACTHEDTSNCAQGIQLHFTHLLNKQNQNLFGEKVNGVSVYVFGADGKFVDTYVSGNTKLTNDYVMTLSLKPGTYRLIVLGGDMNTYQVGEMSNSQSDNFDLLLRKGVTDINHFAFLINKEYQAGSELNISSELSHLFYGYASGLDVEYGTYTDATIDLIRDTKRINVRITGYRFLTDHLFRDQQNPGIDVEALSLNGRYKNDNSIDEYAKKLRYIFSNNKQSGDTLNYTAIMMRLLIENDPSQLKVILPAVQNELYNKNMVEQICKNPQYKTQTDLDREETFNFDISILPDLNISIKINGWEIIEVTPDHNKIN
ncbi:MAG: FimB/Mfa2 family fimbrial subunit [Bacteroidales bacterium]